MKLLSNVHPPYKSAWAGSANGVDAADVADKWLAEPLEEGYVLHSASGAVSTGLTGGSLGMFLVVRYDPEAALSLVEVCNEQVS